MFAVSVDPVDESRKLAESLGLSFPLYSDPERRLIEAWGVADATRRIALPATFVVAAGGSILFRHVGERPPDRPAVDAILSALR